MRNRQQVWTGSAATDMSERRSVGSAGLGTVGQVVPDRLYIVAHAGVQLAQYLGTQFVGEFRQFFLGKDKRGWAGMIDGGFGRDGDGAVSACNIRANLCQTGEKPQSCVFFDHFFILPQADFRPSKRFIWEI